MSRESPTVRDLVTSYITEQCQIILLAEGELRAGENVIHTTRVAIRRLRSTLRVFGDLFDVPQAGRVEEELVWFAGLLGEVRDLDILERRLLASVAALPTELVIGPVQAHLQEEIGVRRKAALEVVQETLDAERYRHLLLKLEVWRSDPPLTEAAEQPAAKLAAYVRRADRRLHRRFAGAVRAHSLGDPGSVNADAADLLHSARKAGKRHRYAAELAQPVLGSKADKVIDLRKELQDVLGDYQDSVVSAEFLRVVGAQAGSTTGQNGFTYGLLYARELDSRRLLAERLKPFLP